MHDHGRIHPHTAMIMQTTIMLAIKMEQNHQPLKWRADWGREADSNIQLDHISEQENSIESNPRNFISYGT